MALNSLFVLIPLSNCSLAHLLFVPSLLLFVLGAVLKLKFDSGFRLDAIERMLTNPNAYQSPVCVV